MKRSAVKPLRFAALAPLALCVALVAAPALANAATTGLYVQNGLIACWDGIENAGVGVHNPSATVWKDLVAGREFALTNVTVDDDRMTFAGPAGVTTPATSYGTLSAADTTATFGNAVNGTMEIVYASRNKTASSIILQAGRLGLSFGIWLTGGSSYILPYSSASNVSKPSFVFESGTATNAVSVRYSSGYSESAFANGSSLGVYQDNHFGTTGDETIIGTRAAKNNCHFDGSIYCIRLYDRKLTDAEIVANHNVDVVRFILGDIAASLVVTSLPVDIGSPSPAYGETNGLAAADSFLVSCGAAVVTDAAGTTQYSCTGWKLYDDANAVVSNGVETSFTYVHPTPSAYRRLEWQWEASAYRGTIAAGYGGAVSQSGTGWFAAGTPVTVTATPNAGSSFKRWTGTLPDGLSASSASATFTPTAPFSMTAIFETVGNGGLVFFNEKTSSYWHTATNCVIDLPIEFPDSASSATLSVTGVGYSAQYAIPSGTEQYTLSLPPATSSTAENVYDLALAFNDSASTVRTAKLGLIYGHDATTTGWTRCLAPAGTRAWSKTKGVAVIPIPYGTTSFTIALDGGEATSTDTGLDGAAGWYPLRLKGETTADLAATTLEGSLSASLRGDGAGFFLIVR